jgi:hypothetical protein
MGGSGVRSQTYIISIQLFIHVKKPQRRQVLISALPYQRYAAMAEDNEQNFSDEKPIGHDHPLVNEDELDNSPVDKKFRGNWKNIKNNPRAIVGFYKNYKNVPKQHREKAIEKIRGTEFEISTDFLSIQKIEREVHPKLIQAYSIAVLESFADQIEEKAQWLESNISHDQSSPIDSYPKEVGYKVFELHILTTTFIESSSYHILKHKIKNRQLPDRESLISWGSHKDRAGVDEESLSIESQEAEIFQWAADSGTHALSRALLQSKIINDKIYKKINCVRNHRNDLVHDPATLTIKRFLDGKTILDRAKDATDIVRYLKSELNQIPKHPIYQSITDT